MEEPDRKRAWARENRQGRGEEGSTFTYTDIMKARGYDMPKPTKKRKRK